MATASSSSMDTPVPPERDYLHPGVFVLPRYPLFVVEDAGLSPQDLPQGIVPWDSLAIIKQYAPEESRDIVICGWPGVADILRQLEQAVIRRAREGARQRGGQ